MFLQLFQFMINIVVRIFWVWTKFELAPGVNYLYFICACNLLSILAYIIFGAIKSEISNEISREVHSAFARRKAKSHVKKEKIRRKLK